MRASQTIVALVAATTVTIAGVRVADACGCLSPPAPVGDEAYAVNQQAEQIIFEVEPNYVTAHVLIKYAGDPASFAWIVPVPEAPQLGISPVSAFGLLERETAPDVTVNVENLCPQSEWQCQVHAPPSCGGFGGDDDFPSSVLDAASASDSSGGGGGGTPPVEVIGEEIVGDYQTVTFRASEAAAATQWLRDNGFIVNQSTALYMEPYVEANMVFVAAKLVPGAGVDAIKPLKLRFRASFPMIPLVLTAVAAEPHLTVTAFIYGAQPFRPMSHPMVTLDAARVARDSAGRLNYPMVLARAIDEAGGDGFVVEYSGGAPRPRFGGNTTCCDNMFDVCGVGGNTTCECPRDSFDQAACAASGDLVEGVALLDALVARYPYMTRLTTRISPEEMRFDPTFEPATAAGQPSGRLVVRGAQRSLDGCWSRVVNRARLDDLEAKQTCAAVYCGAGQCVTTADGPACACNAGQVARRFVDLDGLPSVTCIPATPPVDLEAGGLDLPDACAGISCAMGTCVDRNGVAVCACDGAAAAVAGSGPAPRCVPVEELTQTPGAEDFTEPMRDLAVCAPPPPSCGPTGWLVRVGSPRLGQDCGDATPTAAQLEIPPAPTCPEGTDPRSLYGCGCQGGHPAGALALVWIVGFLLLRRRRAAR